MRLMHLILGLTSGSILILLILSLVFLDFFRLMFDPYANVASGLGLLISLVGFALTVWTVLETLKVQSRTQEELARQVREARQETRDMLANVRAKLLGDACDQAFYMASEARHAIRSAQWLRGAERCHDARQAASRVLSFPALREAERTALRGAVEDLRNLTAFIEKYRLKQGAPAGLPGGRAAPLDALVDELERIRLRLQHQVLEVPDGDNPTT